MMTPLRAISPVDGRYARALAPFSDYLSEWALLKYRVLIEIRWLICLSRQPDIKHVRQLTPAESAWLEALAAEFDDAAAQRIKVMEAEIHHDVKAVELYIRERLAATSMADLRESVHFACTSDDINNLAYALMIRAAMRDIWLPQAADLLEALRQFAREHAAQPMLARTHGQAATPTTVGKEIAVFARRLRRQLQQLQAQDYRGKFNGAVGAFNAQRFAYADVDWRALSREFVQDFGLQYNPLTTQIEDHDYLAELAHGIMRFNTVLLDFCRDCWAYISRGYFRQKAVAAEVGSSTMPHKVNPINFENAEANLGISSATLAHLAQKLPVSRLQRDLSDSSALRNFGVGIAHSSLALSSAARGLSKIAVDAAVLAADLEDAWEVLAEAAQTILRVHNVPAAYDRLKAFTRGKAIDRARFQAFVDELPLPPADKERLLALSPAEYIGYARELALSAADEG